MPQPDHESGDKTQAEFEKRINDYAKAVNENRDADANALMFEAFAMAADEAMRNPSPQLTWSILASDCEEAGNLPAAEDALKKSIEIGRDHSNPGYPVKSLLDLARIYRKQGRDEEAKAQVAEALARARQSQLTALVLSALEAKYAPGLPSAELEEISSVAAEALQSLENERIFELVRARLLLLRSDCAADLGNIPEAEQSFAAASRIVDSRTSAPGTPGWTECRRRLTALCAKLGKQR